MIQLLEGYTSTEAAEIQQYISEWDAATYTSVAQSILDHANRKGIDPLRYLRKAHNFNKKGAIRVPKTGYSASGYYAIQFFSFPSPIKAFRFEDVPHSCRKCCIVEIVQLYTVKAMNI
ncbi:hypothetical protein [Nostoc sp.]|uniref:hypothetical protein n=1 Tax=Nostoc sp. TaxID=1180 RepID=UPI002FFA61D9